VTVSHIRRVERTGFKAGALAHGMTKSHAPFIAIFDADFRPAPDFLKQTLPHFKDAKIGVVQTRWGHINAGHSILTRAQTVMLDAHFGVEQIGRSTSGGFINFNGTAGIWRRTCIESAGGWHADTLTEDLDLSFRAQAKKWKIHFLSDVVSPAELPTTFGAFRNQQFRWSKGAAECFRKNIGLLWRAPVSFHSKLIGSFHLLNSSVYLLVLFLTALAPAVFFVNETQPVNPYQWVPLIGMSVNIMLILVFLVGKLLCEGFKWRTVFWFLPSLYFFFSMSIGISLHMVMGVVEGYRGKKSPFIRTPKFGVNQKTSLFKKRQYHQNARFNLKPIEFLFFGYGLFWLYIGITQHNAFIITYSFILITGFSLALFFDQNPFRIRETKAGQAIGQHSS
jgi:cellulose synthase/poly-beta-1,6-N-acetylglucosamine synthase-like glycosyltransferase